MRREKVRSHLAAVHAPQGLADNSTLENLSRIFTRPAPNQHKDYDYVFNCAGETRYSQADDIYRLRSHALSIALGNECARRKTPVYVELSTGQVYSPSRVPRKETDKCKPVLRLAKWKLKAEEDLAAIKGLNLVILRLANVYGKYCGTPLANACCAARVYQEEGKDMRWLWDKELRVDSVHVDDVARAIWTAAEWYTKETGTHASSRTTEPDGNTDKTAIVPSDETQHASGDNDEPVATLPPRDSSTLAEIAPASAEVTLLDQPTAPIEPAIEPTPTPAQRSPLRPPPLFNITSPQPTTQLHLSNLLSAYFSIQSTFTSSLLSPFARLSLSTIVNSANEELMDPWADLLESAGITRQGPISPFMEKELLSDKDMSLDGAEFVKRTGFVYERSRLNAKELEEVVESWKKMGWWP